MSTSLVVNYLVVTVARCFTELVSFSPLVGVPVAEPVVPRVVEIPAVGPQISSWTAVGAQLLLAAAVHALGAGTTLLVRPTETLHKVTARNNRQHHHFPYAQNTVLQPQCDP